MKLEYNNSTIEFIIEYKKRKTVEIKIDLDTTVRVSAPKGANEEDVIDIIKSKLPMISKKLKSLMETPTGAKEKEYKCGEKFLYLGTEYPIQIIIDENVEKNKVSFEQNIFFITIKNCGEAAIKSTMENFYKKECNKIIQKRISYYQKYFNIKPKVIRIEESSKKWGSCNSNRNIDFNWRLAMAPIEIIDYIVVHEMCHMVHMNHSKSFWRLVGKIIPDYKKRSEWLQYNNFRMNI